MSSPESLARRLTACGVAAAGLCLGSCGFALRGVQDLPFQTIAIQVPPYSPFATELSRQIRAGTRTRVVEDAQTAGAVLEILSDQQLREVLTLNAQGRAVEYLLIEKLRFRLRDAQGEELIEPTELQVHRDISSNDSQRLSKESEETLLYRDMQSDLVQQVMRRIAAAHRDAASR